MDPKAQQYPDDDDLRFPRIEEVKMNSSSSPISQFFALSLRGDSIVFRDYCGEVQKGSSEIFFRKVKFWNEDGEGEAPPVFQGTKRMPGTAVTKSVVANELSGLMTEEIFVDIIEKINMTFSSGGYVLTTEILIYKRSYD